jgi:hypothetical protein
MTQKFDDLSPAEQAELRRVFTEALKKIHDERTIEVNGRAYTFGAVPFREGRTVFAFMQKYKESISSRDYSFVDEPEFQKIEKIVESRVLYNGMQLSKLQGHWDEYTQDYVELMSSMIMVFSFPFMPGAAGA